MSTLRYGAIAMVLLVAGCRSESDTVGKTVLTRAVIDTPCPDAIERITSQRCGNAQRCSAKRHDASFQLDACRRDLTSHLQLELDPSTVCPEHVDRRALASCLDAIDKEPCRRSMGSVDQIVACRHSALCARGYPAPLQ